LGPNIIRITMVVYTPIILVNNVWPLSIAVLPPVGPSSRILAKQVHPV